MSTLTASKLATGAGQCRDAVFPPDGAYSGGSALGAVRCAIADGASYGYRCGEWAQILTREACAADHADIAEALSVSLDAWELDTGRYVADRDARGDPLRWYERKNLTSGAFSTLLVLDLLPYDADVRQGCWRAAAIGDSCVFQIPAEPEDWWAHPLLRPEQFGTRPELVPTDRATIEEVGRSLDELAQRWWRWAPGDRFYLCTDALAEWFLRRSRDGGQPWRELDDLLAADDGALVGWLERHVEQRAIRNDDVSVLRLTPM